MRVRGGTWIWEWSLVPLKSDREEGRREKEGCFCCTTTNFAMTLYLAIVYPLSLFLGSLGLNFWTMFPWFSLILAVRKEKTMTHLTHIGCNLNLSFKKTVIASSCLCWPFMCYNSTNPKRNWTKPKPTWHSFLSLEFGLHGSNLDSDIAILSPRGWTWTQR